MAVGPSFSGEVYPVAGVKVSAVEAGVRYSGRKDLVLVEAGEAATVAGVFTTNAFCAAPVIVAKKHLATLCETMQTLSQSSSKQNKPTSQKLQTASQKDSQKISSDGHKKYFLINTGNANAGTGEQGLLDAQLNSKTLAELTAVPIENVLPFSTGVIGELLPAETINQALSAALQALSDDWLSAAEGIMTTDTRPKLCSKRLKIDGTLVTVTGIAKGAGMIKPNMATMLGYIATDAKVSQQSLQKILSAASDKSFNRITVDGDTSTNDACMLIASGESSFDFEQAQQTDQKKFIELLDTVFIELAQGLVKDGEGASKFVSVIVEQGASKQECANVAYTVAESPLVKTALFASDPNWGRLLAAIGRANIANLDVNKIAVFIGDVLIAENGCRAASYNEEAGQIVMQQDEIVIKILLGRGDNSAIVWTTDLSHDYVTINAEYRT